MERGDSQLLATPTTFKTKKNASTSPRGIGARARLSFPLVVLYFKRQDTLGAVTSSNMAVPGRNDSWIASSSSNSSRPTARKRVWLALLFLAAFSINAGHAAGAGKVAAASDAMPVTGRDHSCAPVRVGPGDTDSDTVVAKCWGSGGRTSGKMRYSGQLGTGTPESHGASADSMGERLPPVFLGASVNNYSVVGMSAGLWRSCIIFRPGRGGGGGGGGQASGMRRHQARCFGHGTCLSSSSLLAPRSFCSVFTFFVCLQLTLLLFCLPSMY